MNTAQTLPQIIRDRANRTPAAIVLEEIEGRKYTYREFQDNIERWAIALSGVGVKANDRVATMLTTSADAYCCWLAISSLGAVEVPLHTDYHGKMLDHILAVADCGTAIVEQRFLPRFQELAHEGRLTVVAPDTTSSNAPPGTIPGDRFFDVPGVLDLHEASPYDLSCVIFTSGTTGPSKGVMVPWAQMHYAALSPPENTILPGEAYYAFWPVFHVGGKYALYLPVIREGRVVLRQSFSASNFWSDIAEHRCSFALLIDSMVRFLNKAAPTELDRSHSLRSAMIAPVSEEAIRFSARFGVSLLTAFGMSEIGVPITSNVSDLPDIRSCGRLRSGPPGYEARIVDENDYEVPQGETGELVIRSSEPWTLNSGYLGMPESTSSAWRNGWFHTGDGFRQDEHGFYYFVDRLKDSIRRRGENVSSLEVEALINAHPGISESAAIGVPSEHGEEDIKLVVVCTRGYTMQPGDVHAHAQSVLPRFMVPRYIEMAESLPKTQGTGRIQKKHLRENAVNDRTWDAEKQQ